MANLIRDRLGPTGACDYAVNRGDTFVGWLYRFYVGKGFKPSRNGYAWLFASYAKDIRARAWATFADAKSEIGTW